MRAELNDVERRVYDACRAQADLDTGGDFCLVSDVRVPGLKAAQMAGYLSQLTQKGYIRIDVLTNGKTKYTQLTITQ